MFASKPERLSAMFVLVAGACAIYCFAQQPPPQIAKGVMQDRLDERVPVWLKAFNVTGVGIAYIEAGKIQWTKFYGEQWPGGPHANDRTLYNVASLTSRSLRRSSCVWPQPESCR